MRGVNNSEDGARRGAAEGGGAGGWQVSHDELHRGVCAGGKALGREGAPSYQGPLWSAFTAPALALDASCGLPRQSAALQPEFHPACAPIGVSAWWVAPVPGQCRAEREAGPWDVRPLGCRSPGMPRTQGQPDEGTPGCGGIGIQEPWDAQGCGQKLPGQERTSGVLCPQGFGLRWQQRELQQALPHTEQQRGGVLGGCGNRASKPQASALRTLRAFWLAGRGNRAGPFKRIFRCLALLPAWAAHPAAPTGRSSSRDKAGGEGHSRARGAASHCWARGLEQPSRPALPSPAQPSPAQPCGAMGRRPRLGTRGGSAQPGSRR